MFRIIPGLARASVWGAAPLLLAVSLGGCVSAGPARQGDDVTLQSLSERPPLSVSAQRGRDLAIRRCAGCHTVGEDDGGADEGPPFRRLAFRHNAISLERRFAEVSEHGYGAMPPVSFTSAQAEDLLAYIDTLTPGP